jgi:soluble P-type ATPase
VNPATLLPFMAAVMTGAVVPLVIYLFNRRTALRETNVDTDAKLVTSAGVLVDQLQKQIEILTQRNVTSDATHADDLARLTDQLRIAHIENLRIAAVVAELQTEQDIAKRQIAELLKRVNVMGTTVKDMGTTVDDIGTTVDDIGTIAGRAQSDPPSTHG